MVYISKQIVCVYVCIICHLLEHLGLVECHFTSVRYLYERNDNKESWMLLWMVEEVHNEEEEALHCFFAEATWGAGWCQFTLGIGICSTLQYQWVICIFLPFVSQLSTIYEPLGNIFKFMKSVAIKAEITT